MVHIPKKKPEINPQPWINPTEPLPPDLDPDPEITQPEPIEPEVDPVIEPEVQPNKERY
jgi:hypothetical protein